jgi:plasmid stabilization system protein ParE
VKVVWSESSEFDLDDLYDYIAKDSPIYAEQFVDRILEEVGKVALSPRIGRIVPETQRDDIRERMLQSQRIIYMIDDVNEVISVLALIHVRRNIDGTEYLPTS